MFIRQLCLSGLLVGAGALSDDAHSGACDPESESRGHHQRRIDGPANVRAAPNGRVIGAIRDGALVTLIGFQDVDERGQYATWYKVKWKQGSKSREGWTHEQNIVCD